MKTKTLALDGLSFTIAKLTLDTLRETDETIRAAPTKFTSLSDVVSVYRRACEAAIARGGVTSPAQVGALDVDGMRDLFLGVMRFSNGIGDDAAVDAPGEAKAP